LSYVKYFWDSQWHSAQNCAHWVADALSQRYGRPIRLDVGQSERGVPARALFEAAGSRAEFATYSEVAELLFQMNSGRPGEPGPAAIVASSWAGGSSQGGHAYLAVVDAGQIYLMDPFTGERLGWPPYWGEGAVSRTAVGFLDTDGRPVQRLDGSRNELVAADNVGDVQGHPADADYAGRREEYRALDRTTRRVDTRYAEPLGDILDSRDPQRAQQFAQDLSGVYGSYSIELQAKCEFEFGVEVEVAGAIFTDDTDIGSITWSFRRDSLGSIVVDLKLLHIYEQSNRGQGSFTLRRDLLPLFERSGVDRLELATSWQGAILWARQGFTWNRDPVRLYGSLESIKNSARILRDWFSEETRAVLDEVVQRLEPEHPRLPEPIDLLKLATSDEPKLGRELLDNTHISLVLHLRGGADGSPTALSRNEIGAQPSLGSRADAVSLSGSTCAHLVAGALSARYGRDIGIDAEPTPRGVPARALFQAVGSDAQFATYGEVADRLRQLGDGSSAVLASRWAGGRQGGHAYLAVNDGGRIDLYDPHTGQRSGWPPHWGEDAVDRTAVGYLDAGGNAVNPLHDVSLQLAAADAIGDVKGPLDRDPSQSQLADEALAQRVPLVEAAQLVHPIGDAQLGVERAQANASWWQGLNEDQRQALVETYPAQIGNAEGIPPFDCHEANTRSLQDYLRYRDQLQSRLDSGVRLGRKMSRHLSRFTRLEGDLRRAADDARRAGVDGPYLLKFDPMAFREAGIAVVGFGVDPYLAESVSWHIPGRGITIEELGPVMGSALNHLMSILREDPTASAASMTWIGYDTLADDAPQIGGEGLYSDIRAFNAGRDAWAADGSHFSGNHVFGHCQGSTVAGNAGEGERLHGEVRTVILFGSPGAGPITDASEFGPGVDVYVAASSIDPLTWPELRSAFLNTMGVDPAMDFFGAQRVTAEFPLTKMDAITQPLVGELDGAGAAWTADKAGDYDIHNSYYKFVDKDTGQRNESLANFGRIAAGHSERVALEGHRTIVAGADQTSRVHDPATLCSVQLEDPASSDFEPADNCAHGVAEKLSARYGREIRIDAPSSPTGVAARALFEAVGSGAEFTSYAEVAERLLQLGPGSSAVLASRWASVRSGGHAYLAVNDGGEVYLMEPRTGQRSGWPPYWGDRAVSRTAVGYLDEQGNPVDPPHDVPLQLAAADAIGDVQGIPDHPDFQRAQEQYRAQDPTTRRADTRYAEPLADVVDNASDMARVHQLAADLSGVYGPYRVELTAYEYPGKVVLDGPILIGDTEIGSVQRIFARDHEGKLIANHPGVVIDEDRFRGRGFSKALSSELERYYQRCGVDRIELQAELDGGYAWARSGFTWDPDPRKLQRSLDDIRARTQELSPTVADDAHSVLDDIVQRLAPEHPRLPEPIDLANLATPNQPDLGMLLMNGAEWHAVKYLRDANAEGDPVGAADVDVPLRLDNSASPEPASVLGLPNHAPGTLSDSEARAVFADGEQRMRGLDERLVRDGVSVEDRARTLSDLRDSLRAWTRDLMRNRVVAEFLAAYETHPTFEELVAHNQAKGLVGDAVYEAISNTATHSYNAPGTLSDIETTDLYSQFELQMRAYHDQLIRDGVSVEQRARTLSELRNSLRAWTRDLMSNRVVAEFLAAYEGRSTFEDLVAHYEEKGLVGDAVYEAIIHTATHSHYATGTLSDDETRTVYTTFELRMRDVHERLFGDGVGAEERARTLYDMRAALRTWTRALMENRELAEWLNANEPNPTFEALVERQRKKGLEGDAIYEAIIASATRSRASVNEALGIDPDNPPPLPPMRGPTE
jgi:hypothetical protein